MVFLVGDEAGLYLHATTCFVWSPTGQTPNVRADRFAGMTCQFLYKLKSPGCIGRFSVII